MALVLAVALGETLYVNNQRALVVSDIQKTYLTLTSEGEDFRITNDKATEVFPDVLVGLGDGYFTHFQAKLVIKAPRSIRISRERLMEDKCPQH